MPTTDLTQFITQQLDALPDATAREIIEHLETRYHIRSHNQYSHYGLRRTDIPPAVPFATTPAPTQGRLPCTPE